MPTLPGMLLRAVPGFALLGALVALAGCASQSPSAPANVRIVGDLAAASPLPSPLERGPSAPPEVIAMRFSSLAVNRGERWSGEFVTGSNVASVEVRTNLFSIDVPRTGYGRFAFSLDVLDTPPIFVRKYALRVIARNTAGVETEEDLPFEIR